MPGPILSSADAVHRHGPSRNIPWRGRPPVGIIRAGDANAGCPPWGVMLEAAQELQQGVSRFETAHFARRGRKFIESTLFHLKIGFHITVSRLDALVPEPQCNDRDIHPGLQQMQSRCMTNDVGCHSFLSQIRALRNCLLDRALQ